METNEAFAHDNTPTPTRFIRNCEEVGLFQDLQNVNPFEETFRIAVQTSNGSSPPSLPEPLSKSATSDTLDTPLVVPNTKKDTYNNSFIEDDEDVIELSDNYNLIELMLPEEPRVEEEKSENNSQSLPDIEIIEEIQEEENDQEQEENVDDVPVIDLTSSSSPVRGDVENSLKMIKSNENLNGNSLLKNEGKINKTFSKTEKNVFNQFPLTNNHIPTVNNMKSAATRLQHVILPAANLTKSALTDGKNIFILPTDSIQYAGSRLVKISPKPDPQTNLPKESTVKERLKERCKITNGENTLKLMLVPHSVASSSSTTQPTKTNEEDDEVTYSRERNRMAQIRSRLKKKKWMTQLRRDTESIYHENRHLQTEVGTLRAEIAHLKTLLLAHRNCSVTRAMYEADISTLINKEAIKHDTVLHKSRQANAGDKADTLPSPVYVHVPVPLKQAEVRTETAAVKSGVKQNVVSEMSTTQPQKVQILNDGKKLIFNSRIVPIKADESQRQNVVQSYKNNVLTIRNVMESGTNKLAQRKALKVVINEN